VAWPQPRDCYFHAMTESPRQKPVILLVATVAAASSRSHAARRIEQLQRSIHFRVCFCLSPPFLSYLILVLNDDGHWWLTCDIKGACISSSRLDHLLCIDHWVSLQR
jgi:hypothetical protein